MKIIAFNSIKDINNFLKENDEYEHMGSIPEGIEPPIQDGFLDSPVTTRIWTAEFELVYVYTIDKSNYTGEDGHYDNIRTYILVDTW